MPSLLKILCSYILVLVIIHISNCKTISKKTFTSSTGGGKKVIAANINIGHGKEATISYGVKGSPFETAEIQQAKIPLSKTGSGSTSGSSSGSSESGSGSDSASGSGSVEVVTKVKVKVKPGSKKQGKSKSAALNEQVLAKPGIKHQIKPILQFEADEGFKKLNDIDPRLQGRPAGGPKLASVTKVDLPTKRKRNEESDYFVE